MVLVKNDSSGTTLRMLIGLTQPEWYSVLSERRLRTSREIIREVISWLKPAPKALRSRGASCR